MVIDLRDIEGRYFFGWRLFSSLPKNFLPTTASCKQLFSIFLILYIYNKNKRVIIIAVDCVSKFLAPELSTLVLIFVYYFYHLNY